jgi:hypothetical protein
MGGFPLVDVMLSKMSLADCKGTKKRPGYSDDFRVKRTQRSIWRKSRISL